MVQDTKNQILDFAEKLFAEQGYAATSLRQITAAAGVNLAAIHYHFHSKEALLEAVVSRRCKDLNEARLAALAPVVAGKARPAVRGIIEALIRPAFAMARSEGAATFAKVLGRLYAEPDLASRVFKKSFGPTSEHFLDALAKAMPTMSRDEVMWRYHFVVGALGQTMMKFPHIQPPPDEDALIAFLTGGFSAPPTAKVKKK